MPESALRLLAAGEVAAILQGSLATDVPLAETDGVGLANEFSPRAASFVTRVQTAQRRRGPDGEWLNSGAQQAYGKPQQKTLTGSPESGHIGEGIVRARRRRWRSPGYAMPERSGPTPSGGGAIDSERISHACFTMYG